MSRYADLRKARRERGECANCGRPSKRYRCDECGGAAAARRPGKTREPSYLERSFGLMVSQAGLPEPVGEYRFHATRRWRFDFAWPAHMVAVEIEGISPDGGRHQRLPGFLADCEKQEAALLAGWLVYRVPGQWIANATRHAWRVETIEALRSLLGSPA